GGNKDKSKRPLMGKIVSKQSDFTIFTSDNPRNENPNSIIEEILSGVDKNSKHIIIIDRAEAIKTACLMADEYDIILVAGKGHENYQEVNGSKKPFNDLKEINKHLKTI
ncbi:MAG: UDP-N-acetylmuramoyl-L-alanyl-D-glutamate--2,6-diaminopimelate ligase, partial [Bacteroidota bacterium]|nr:UDP-N-acetylmuramoyl-L-alanyl-D-glutamate--2,6-diaminopimelate ligase [Bacteroidota bacterium]